MRAEITKGHQLRQLADRLGEVRRSARLGSARLGAPLPRAAKRSTWRSAKVVNPSNATRAHRVRLVRIVAPAKTERPRLSRKHSSGLPSLLRKNAPLNAGGDRVQGVVAQMGIALGRLRLAVPRARELALIKEIVLLFVRSWFEYSGTLPQDDPDASANADVRFQGFLEMLARH
jgi:hypothetical protein